MQTGKDPKSINVNTVWLLNCRAQVITSVKKKREHTHAHSLHHHFLKHMRKCRLFSLGSSWLFSDSKLSFCLLYIMVLQCCSRSISYTVNCQICELAWHLPFPDSSESYLLTKSWLYYSRRPCSSACLYQSHMYWEWNKCRQRLLRSLEEQRHEARLEKLV